MSTERDKLLSDMKNWEVHGGGHVIDDSEDAIANAILNSDWLEGLREQVWYEGAVAGMAREDGEMPENPYRVSP